MNHSYIEAIAGNSMRQRMNTVETGEVIIISGGNQGHKLRLTIFGYSNYRYN